jgi:hypothetical protein
MAGQRILPHKLLVVINYNYRRVKKGRKLLFLPLSVPSWEEEVGDGGRAKSKL